MNLETASFKSSLLHGEHGTQKVCIFLPFHVNLPFLVSSIIHLLNGGGRPDFLSALWKNTPDYFCFNFSNPCNLFDFQQALTVYN